MVMPSLNSYSNCPTICCGWKKDLSTLLSSVWNSNGWIEGEWGLSASNRRARFYTLTSDGRKHLNAEATRYRQVTGAVARIMGFA